MIQKPCGRLKLLCHFRVSQTVCVRMFFDEGFPPQKNKLSLTFLKDKTVSFMWKLYFSLHGYAFCCLVSSCPVLSSMSKLKWIFLLKSTKYADSHDWLDEEFPSKEQNLPERKSINFVKTWFCSYYVLCHLVLSCSVLSCPVLNKLLFLKWPNCQ